MKRVFSIALCLAASLIAVSGSLVSAKDFTIVVDYTYDTNNFFASAASKVALQAAADRFSGIINSNLDAVGPGGTGSGTGAGWRVGFTHPGTGASFQLSTATSSGTDPLFGFVGAADAYNFSGLNADEWILYAGGRPQGAAGSGGTGTGTNFTSTFDDINGPMHRGFNDNTPSNSVSDLPRWGGAISFDTGTSWNFDLNSTGGGVDFYSIALHEIGHALGLNSSWNQWQDDGGGNYIGSEALAAYNADNGTSLTSLNQVGGSNDHWEDGTYESFLFPGGNTVGTVPGGTKQDLLMEPIANFGGLQQRFELTNTDVAALRDLGWSTVPEPSSAMTVLFAGAMIAMKRRRLLS